MNEFQQKHYHFTERIAVVEGAVNDCRYCFCNRFGDNHCAKAFAKITNGKSCVEYHIEVRE